MVGRPFQPGNRVGKSWPKGVSGNPSGLPRTRRLFEQAFYEALIGEGSAQEAAALLWKAARAGEAWGIQLLLQRIAPMDSKVKLEVSRGHDEFDFTRLSDAQLRDLETIVDAAYQPAAIEGGAMPAESEDVPRDGMADH